VHWRADIVKKPITVVAGTLVALLLIVMIFNLSQRRPVTQAVPLSEFLHELDRGGIADVMIRSGEVTGHFDNGRVFATYVPPEIHDLIDRLLAKGVQVSAAETPLSLFNIIISWIPYFVGTAIWWWLVARPLRRIAASVEAIGSTTMQLVARREPGLSAPREAPPAL
jgi:ATP-dependent Zn protease